jgi:hypothetical protein
VKTIKTILLLLLCLYGSGSYATVSPTPPYAPSFSITFKSIKPKVIENMLGRKLTLLQKIELRILQKKLSRHAFGPTDTITEKQKKQAKLSMTLGICSIALLFLGGVVGGIGLLAFPAAIAAVVLGIISLKGNSNTQGIVGVITGGLTLALFLLAILFILAFIGAFN